MAINVHYAEVLGDLHEKQGALRREIANLRKELEELDRIVAAIQKIAPQEIVQGSLELDGDVVEPFLPNLTGMSMRWGILSLLAEYFESPLSWSEIAEYLQKGGLPDPNGKLRKNVSAVLSRMVGLEEIENNGNGYTVTAFGRDMWASIKKSPKFLNRDSSEEDVVMEGI